MLAYRDRAHREDVWAKFNADPEWTALRTKYFVPLTPPNTFLMSATDSAYSRGETSGRHGEMANGSSGAGSRAMDGESKTAAHASGNVPGSRATQHSSKAGAAS